jgi:hypothetical protein
MKYSNELNGIMLATNPGNKYIVMFENGKSLQGMGFDKKVDATPTRYFGNSGFTATSDNYDYTPASPEDSHYLLECIKSGKLINKYEALKTFQSQPSYQIY